MCNRYASDIRKAGKEKEYYGFDEWSETRITPILGNALLKVFISDDMDHGGFSTARLSSTPATQMG